MTKQEKRKRTYKKLVSFIFGVLCICSLFISCASDESLDLLRKAKEITPLESDVDSSKNDYGASAYAIVKYIQAKYPGRIAGTEKEKEMAQFILSALINGGYSEDELNVSRFSISDSVPAMVDSINQFDGGKKSDFSQNVEVIKQGKSEQTIIVGAHYDSVGTHGVDDNGSGVSVVLENALRMLDVQTEYTIRFVFFGSKEIGMCGLRAYVDALTDKEKENIVLMVNVDSILTGDYLYIYGGRINESGNVDNSEAVLRTAEIASEKGLDIQLPPTGNEDYPFPTGQKQSDHAPFSDIGIPYVYFEANYWDRGFPSETEKYGLIIHTDMDDLNFLEDEYGERAEKSLSSYSELLNAMLQDEEWNR